MRPLRMALALLTVAGAGLGGLALSPVARAEMPVGNYNLNIGDRFDFHTWIWWVRQCGDGCVSVNAIAQPIARAFGYRSQATLMDGRYVLAVDVPDGLRCGNVYYGRTIPTRDVYTWDAITLAGSLESSFAAGCDGAPGTLTYPFSLTRL